jgi:hypothetical protein
MATFRVSSGSNSFFTGERTGDVMLYPPSGDSSSRILLGNTSNIQPVLTLEGQTATVAGVLNSVEVRSPYVFASELRIGTGDQRLAEFSATIPQTQLSELLEQLEQLRARVAALESPFIIITNFALLEGEEEPTLTLSVLAVPVASSVASLSPFSLNPMNGLAIELTLDQPLTWTSFGQFTYHRAELLRLSATPSGEDATVDLSIAIDKHEGSAAMWKLLARSTPSGGTATTSQIIFRHYASVQSLLDDSAGSWRFVLVPGTTSFRALAYKNDVLKWVAVAENSQFAVLNQLLSSTQSVLNASRVLGTAVSLPIKLSKDQGALSLPAATFPVTLAVPASGTNGASVVTAGRFTSFGLEHPSYGADDPAFLHFSPNSSMCALDLALPTVESFRVDFGVRFNSLRPPPSVSWRTYAFVFSLGERIRISITIGEPGYIGAFLETNGERNSPGYDYEEVFGMEVIQPLTLHQVSISCSRDIVSGHLTYGMSVDGVSMGSFVYQNSTRLAFLGPTGVTLRNVYVNTSPYESGEMYDMDVTSLSVSSPA